MGGRVLEVSSRPDRTAPLWLKTERRAGVVGDLVASHTGTWQLVAGGGGYQMGQHDPAPYCNDPSGSCFNGTGGATYGYTWFNNLANPWHDSYYWLDGEVKLSIQEMTGLYNVAVQTSSKRSSLPKGYLFTRVVARLS